MTAAVLYARVSSREQEREGYSIPAQLKLLREYAVKNSFKLVREFVDVETAKTTGRKEFGEMVEFLKKHKDCRTVIVEKTDRLYRYIHKMLRNEFYCGYFTWAGERHKGTHSALINPNLFQRVQAIFAGHNKPKYRKHKFAFSGLLTCAFDDCMVTAGMQKQKYTYY